MERKQLTTKEEAVKSHENHLIDGIQSGKWMSAVWKIEDGNIVLVGRTTWEFPKGDLVPATALLREDCQKEVDESPITAFGSVLPRANACCPDGRVPFGIINTEEKVKSCVPESIDVKAEDLVVEENT